jgi:hypothetical protein
VDGLAPKSNADDVEEPWQIAQPELLDDVRRALEAYPALHLFDTESGVEIRGTFPVRDLDGRAIDEYQIRIVFRPTYPQTLPVVYETASRIPWTAARHIFRSGACCVLLPDARWEEFPVGAPFKSFLAGPLHNYFLGQTLVEAGKPWPFGEWGHGDEGRFEYFGKLLGATDRATIRRFLELIGWPNENTRPRCPCGSGKRLSKCCGTKVRELRAKLPRDVARGAFQRLGFHRAGHFTRPQPKRRRR